MKRKNISQNIRYFLEGALDAVLFGGKSILFCVGVTLLFLLLFAFDFYLVAFLYREGGMILAFLSFFLYLLFLWRKKNKRGRVLCFMLLILHGFMIAFIYYISLLDGLS